MSAYPYLLSVIVPFYNNADFIVDSLRSLLNQVTDDVEIVIIDDGSTDDSVQRVTQLLEGQTAHHATLICQPNGGIAHARNVGLANVRGRYVTFLDGDDLLSSDYWQILRPLLLADQYDIIDFNYQKFSETVPTQPQGKKTEIYGYDFKNQGLACLMPLFTRSMWHLWSRVYRHTLLEGESFATGRRYEDVIFTPFLYFKTRKIAHIEQVLYFYRDNNLGITRNHSEKDIADLQFAMSKMTDYALQHQHNSQIRPLAALMIANCFCEIKNITKKIHGCYRYSPELRNALQRAAKVCQGTKVPSKKVCQMRYPYIDELLSKVRIGLKKH